MKGSEIIETPKGARVIQNYAVLSEVLREPGQTGSVFDVLAAAVAALAPGANIALLGFAAGGMIAPLRAMGGNHRICGVDLSDKGWRLFRKLSGDWRGDVSFAKADVVHWLKDNSEKFDMIIEDLSVPIEHDVFKPEITWTTLPKLIRNRLSPDGLVLTNVLRHKSITLPRLKTQIIAPAKQALDIRFAEFENHFLLSGCGELTARQLTSRIKKPLRAIDSDLTDNIRATTFHAEES